MLNLTERDWLLWAGAAFIAVTSLARLMRARRDQWLRDWSAEVNRQARSAETPEGRSSRDAERDRKAA